MDGKREITSYPRPKRERRKEKEEPSEKEWGIKPVGSYLSPQAFYLLGLCLMNFCSIRKASIPIMSNPTLLYFLPSPQLTPPIAWKDISRSRVGEWGLSQSSSPSCFDCLSAAPRLCFIFGAQTLKWNGMLEYPGCLYNKEHVASLGNNETQWIAIQFFVVLPALEKAKIWPNIESGHLFCSQYRNG